MISSDTFLAGIYIANNLAIFTVSVHDFNHFTNHHTYYLYIFNVK